MVKGRERGNKGTRKRTRAASGSIKAFEGSQVSAKALAESNLMSGVIDVQHLSRYSQGQIPELVANTIPRSFKAAQSNRSALSTVLRFLNSQQPAPLALFTPLFASAMFAAQVYFSFPAVAHWVAAGFFLTLQPAAWRL
jgi:hypothetical protein